MFVFSVLDKNIKCFARDMLYYAKDNPSWRYTDWAMDLVDKKKWSLYGEEISLVGGYVSLKSHGQSNFLTFQRASGEKYSVVQRLSCFWAIVDHQENQVYLKKAISESRKAPFRDFYQYSQATDFGTSAPDFDSFLFSNHNRPYHQVYDCMPSFIYF